MKVTFLIFAVVFCASSASYAIIACSRAASMQQHRDQLFAGDSTRFLRPKGGYAALIKKVAEIEVQMRDLNAQYDKAKRTTESLQADYAATNFAKYFAKKGLFAQQLAQKLPGFKGDYKHAKQIEDSIKESQALQEKISKQSNALGLGTLKSQFAPIVRDALQFSLDRRLFRMKSFSILNISGLTGRDVQAEKRVRFNVRTSVQSEQGETKIVEIAIVFDTATGKVAKAAVFEQEDINHASTDIASQAYGDARHSAMIAQLRESQGLHLLEEAHPRGVDILEKYKGFRENTVLDRNLKTALNFDRRLRKLQWVAKVNGIKAENVQTIARATKSSKLYSDHVDSVIALVESKRVRQAQDDAFSMAYFTYLAHVNLDIQLLPLRYFMYYYLQAPPESRVQATAQVTQWSQQVQNTDTPIQEVVKKDIESGVFVPPADLKATMTEARDISTINNLDYDRQYMTPDAQKDLTQDLSQGLNATTVIESSVSANRDILGGQTRVDTNPFASFADSLATSADTNTDYGSSTIGD